MPTDAQLTLTGSGVAGLFCIQRYHIPLDLVVNRWLHRVRAAQPVSSCCYTSSDDVSSPDEISHKLSNINGLRFCH